MCWRVGFGSCRALTFHVLFTSVERNLVLRTLVHPAAVSFGLANLYLLSVTGPLIAPNHDLVYHLIGSASSIVIPIIVYLLILSLLLTVLLSLAKRPGRLRILLWCALLLTLPSTLLHTYTTFSGNEVPGWLVDSVVLIALLVLLSAAVFWRRFQPSFERFQPAAANILGFFSFSGLLIFGQLIWCAAETRNLNPRPALHHPQTASFPADGQRIVWLVLDELSYQQVYERRYPGLELPAFDQLAAQSTVFTHTVPIGEYTRFILPTLFTGLPSDEIRVSARGLLVSLRDPASGRWNAFQQHDTVFQDALNAGYSTGIAGWYNPYCRIMPEVLDRCFWTYRQSTPANLSPNRSLVADLLRPLRSLFLNGEHLLGYGPGTLTDESRDLRQHSADYRDLIAAGDAELKDPSISFLFLHMPVPHPYGFYDRKQRRFSTTHTSYVDNLALADQYLGHLRQILEQEHQWDSTTVLVMGDHAWRTSFLWAESAGWTAEDAAASHHGEFDDRPAYLLKLPDQHAPARIDGSFAAVHTRALLDALLQGRVRTPADLQAWAALQR